jgi:hypothetical protein
VLLRNAEILEVSPENKSMVELNIFVKDILW